MLISGKRSIPDMKTGLVVEGGGMKCAYSAGILDRFLDEHITFDYCIGVSAGSANVASYLAGQRLASSGFPNISAVFAKSPATYAAYAVAERIKGVLASKVR